jgi:Flp pilus assembly protein TadG
MKSQKGQSLVEFALVLPILIFILFGIIDFSRVFHAYLTIDHAGREAARAASIGEDIPTAVDIAVTDASGIGLIASKVRIDRTTSVTDVKVTITYPITFFTPIIGNIVGPITLSDTTVMRVE